MQTPINFSKPPGIPVSHSNPAFLTSLGSDLCKIAPGAPVFPDFDPQARDPQNGRDSEFSENPVWGQGIAFFRVLIEKTRLKNRFLPENAPARQNSQLRFPGSRFGGLEVPVPPRGYLISRAFRRRFCGLVVWWRLCYRGSTIPPTTLRCLTAARFLTSRCSARHSLRTIINSRKPPHPNSIAIWFTTIVSSAIYLLHKWMLPLLRPTHSLLSHLLTSIGSRDKFPRTPSTPVEFHLFGVVSFILISVVQ